MMYWILMYNNKLLIGNKVINDIDSKLTIDFNIKMNNFINFNIFNLELNNDNNYYSKYKLNCLNIQKNTANKDIKYLDNNQILKIINNKNDNLEDANESPDFILNNNNTDFIIKNENTKTLNENNNTTLNNNTINTYSKINLKKLSEDLFYLINNNDEGFYDYSKFQIFRFNKFCKEVALNFIWVFKCLTILSPPIIKAMEDSYCFNIYRKVIINNLENNKNISFPLYIIEFKRFKEYLNNYFKANNYILDILERIIDLIDGFIFIKIIKGKGGVITVNENETEVITDKNKLNKNNLYKKLIIYDKLLFVLRYYILSDTENLVIDNKVTESNNKNNNNLEKIETENNKTNNSDNKKDNANNNINNDNVTKDKNNITEIFDNEIEVVNKDNNIVIDKLKLDKYNINKKIRKIFKKDIKILKITYKYKSNNDHNYLCIIKFKYNNKDNKKKSLSISLVDKDILGDDKLLKKYDNFDTPINISDIKITYFNNNSISILINNNILFPEIPTTNDINYVFNFSSNIFNCNYYNKKNIAFDDFLSQKEKLKEYFYQIFKPNIEHHKLVFYYYQDLLYVIDFTIKAEDNEMYDIRIILEDFEDNSEIVENIELKEFELSSKLISNLVIYIYNQSIYKVDVNDGNNVLNFEITNNITKPDIIISVNNNMFIGYTPEYEEDNNIEEFDNYDHTNDNSNFNNGYDNKDDVDDCYQELVYPSPYDNKDFETEELRIDVSFYNTDIYDNVKNSINVNYFDICKFYENFNELHNYFCDIFKNSYIIPNDIKPKSVGQFIVYLTGMGNEHMLYNKLNSKNIKTHKDMLKINDIRSIYFSKILLKSFNLVKIFDKIFYEIINNSTLKNLVIKQKASFKYLYSNNIRFKVIDSNDNKTFLVDIPIIENNADNKFSKKNDIFICSNYGCKKEVELDSTEKCTFHFGKWDFGHTGTTLKETINNSELILWKEHWTCCGQDWDSTTCKKLHFHNIIPINNLRKLPFGDTFERIGQCNFIKKKKINKNYVSLPKERIEAFIKEKYIRAEDNNSFKSDNLIDICDKLKLHLLAIGDDLSYHYKYYDALKGNANKYLSNNDGYIDLDEFLKWWFCGITEIFAYK